MGVLQSFKVKSKIHDYEVNFGSIDKLEETLNNGDVIIIDRAVRDVLPDGIGLITSENLILWLDGNEDAKQYTNTIVYIRRIIASGFRRGNKIIAIGGGVTQDLTGFIASILYRGVDWVFYPTTLLAQGDSCIGGKSSINFGEYKNQIGGFYPPSQIIIDTKFLETLPKNQITSGLGEMAHYFLIEGGEDLEFFGQLNFKERLEEIVRRSLLIKKKMIEIDEFDKGPRLVFNYGHSFGHAIETVTDYGIPHGIAVAYGMDMANFVSYKLGLVDEKFVKDALYILKEFFGDLEIRRIMIDIAKDDSYISEKLIPALKRDKKNKEDKLGLILTRGFGDMFLEFVAPEKVEGYLKEYFKYRINK
jgi:3-dehydroquinate synthase